MSRIALRAAALSVGVVMMGCGTRPEKSTGPEMPARSGDKEAPTPPEAAPLSSEAARAEPEPPASPPPDPAPRPLKVYILAGQSNMEGQATVSTFDHIGMYPDTAPLLEAMRGDDGKPVVCDDVYISYLTGVGGWGRPMVPKVKQGKLTAGFGALSGGVKIGPEFTFGIYVQRLLGEPVLLIKTAWGGKSLHTDFRPPSAGRYELPEKIRERWEKHPQGAHGIPKAEDRPKWRAEKDKATGRYYRLMVEHVKKVLGDIKRVYPDYDPGAGYELAGLVWFQGWNDMCDGGTYPDRNKPGGYDEYSRLLAHFIRDVRKDLGAPGLPFVIGVMGVGGLEDMKLFRAAMAAPASLPEFEGNVVAVETAPFWDHELVEAAKKRGKLHGILDTAHYITNEGTLDRAGNPYPGWEAIGTPAPEERTWRYTSFDPGRDSEMLNKKEGKRFRDVTHPAGLEGWAAPGFDDSGWQAGKAPIGKGAWKVHRTTVKNRSDWGDGEFLLMRTTFELDDIDREEYRLSVLARQGFHVYLNGHKIHTYIWWKNRPYYRAIRLGPNEVKHLKRGTNVLAAYANVQYEKRTLEPYASIDLFIEGLTAEGRETWEKSLESVISPREKKIASGASNQAYHYMGSGRIMARIGKAFADAVVELGGKGD